MNSVPRNQSDSDKAVQEFLDKGGKIQQIPIGVRSDIDYKTSFYGSKKPKQKEDDSNDE